MILFILYSITSATALFSLALILSCLGIHPPLCLQGSSRMKVLECKSEDIVLLLKILHWGTYLQDTLESLRVACKLPCFYPGTWPLLATPALVCRRTGYLTVPKGPRPVCFAGNTFLLLTLLSQLISVYPSRLSSASPPLVKLPWHIIPLLSSSWISTSVEHFYVLEPLSIPWSSLYWVVSFLWVGAISYFVWDLWHLLGAGDFNQWVSLDWFLVPKFFCILSVWMSLLTSLYLSRNNNNMPITRIKWEGIAMRNPCTTTKRAPALFN